MQCCHMQASYTLKILLPQKRHTITGRFSRDSFQRWILAFSFSCFLAFFFLGHYKGGRLFLLLILLSSTCYFQKCKCYLSVPWPTEVFTFMINMLIGEVKEMVFTFHSPFLQLHSFFCFS